MNSRKVVCMHWYVLPQEFTEKAEMLLEVDGLRERLVKGGRKRLIERHSEEKEKERCVRNCNSSKFFSVFSQFIHLFHHNFTSSILRDNIAA